MATRIVKGTYTEGSPVSVEAEWPRNNGVLWQQADFTACSVRVFDNSRGAQIATPSRSVTQVLTNTPMSWEISAQGPNFHDVVTDTEIGAEGGHTIQLEYGFTRSDGLGTEYLIFIARAESIGSA